MTSQRNLLIVLCHGLRSDALGDSRCWPLSTPNLDKIAESGLRLSAISACPADDGGLISLLTGLHARQHGYVEQSHNGQSSGSQMGGTMVCEGWPVRLSEADYHVAGVGCIGPY